jgi:hypothetical protein
MKDDTISRRAAIDATWFEPSYTDPLNVLTEVRDRLKVLPSAQPKSYREGYQAGFKDAQSERKRGRWNITDAYPHNVYCSECYTRFAQTHWAVWEDGSLPRNYCPNCGADMREVDE